MKRAMQLLIVVFLIFSFIGFTDSIDAEVLSKLVSRPSKDGSETKSLVLRYSDPNFEESFNQLLDSAKRNNINIYTQTSHYENPVFEFFVQGNYYNSLDLPLSSNAIDFSDINEVRRYSTSSSKGKIEIYTMNKLERFSNAYGEVSQMATVLAPAHLFPLALQEESDETFDVFDAIFVEFFPDENSNIKAFMDEVVSLGATISDGRGIIEIDHFKMKYISFGLVLAALIFVSFNSIFKKDKTKYAIKIIHGYSESGLIFKDFVYSASVALLFASLVLGSFVLYKYSYSSYLVRKSFEVIGLMALITSVIVSVCALLFYRRIKSIKVETAVKNESDKLVNEFIVGFLKIAILMVFLPSLISQSTALINSTSEYIKIKSNEHLYEGRYLISNELALSPAAIIEFGFERQQEIRNDLDDLGGIYFDAQFVRRLEETILERKGKIYEEEYLEFPPGPFQLKTVLVNQEYLRRYPLIHRGDELIDFAPNTVYVPSSLKREFQEDEVDHVSYVYLDMDFSLTNLDINLVEIENKISDVAVFVVGDESKVFTSHQINNNTVWGSPFYGNMSFLEADLEPALSYFENLNQGSRGVHAISLMDRIGEMVDNLSASIARVLPDAVLLSSIIILLSYQSIVDYYSYKGKKLVIERSFGYLFIDSLKYYILSQAIILLVPFIYIMSGAYGRFNPNEFAIGTIGLKSTLRIFALMILYEIVVVILMDKKLSRNIVSVMKGEQIE